MEIGVILVTGQSPFDKTSKVAKNPRGGFGEAHSADRIVRWDLLGRSVLARLVDQLKASGIKLISVVNDEHERKHRKVEPWEKALQEYVNNGVRHTLVISARRYTEIDFAKLILFHRQTSSTVTNVADENGSLGVTLIDSKCADGDGSPLSSRLPAFTACSSTYEYNGYVNHLSSAAEYRELIQRTLAGKCWIRPLGREVRRGVWVASDARIHSSVRLVGPTYVGARSRIRAGALLAATSVERDSEIDCGTVTDSSSILPHTYIGPGLHISQSVVNGSRLLHMQRQLEVDLGETGLIGQRGTEKSYHFLENLGAFIQSRFHREPEQDAPTPSQAAASLERAQ